MYQHVSNALPKPSKLQVTIIALICIIFFIISYINVPKPSVIETAAIVTEQIKEEITAELPNTMENDYYDNYMSSRYANLTFKKYVYPVNFQNFVKQHSNSDLINLYSKGLADFRLMGDYVLLKVIRNSGFSRNGITLVFQSINAPYKGSAYLTSNAPEMTGIIYYQLCMSNNDENAALQQIADADGLNIKFDQKNAPLIISTEGGCIHVVNDIDTDILKIDNITLKTIRLGDRTQLLQQQKSLEKRIKNSQSSDIDDLESQLDSVNRELSELLLKDSKQ